jgi:hypothetical protein
MEIREALEGKEHCSTAEEEEICCPVCGTLWLQEKKGEFTSGTCQHLRFTLHSEGCDEFDFFGEWNPNDFLDKVGQASEKDEDADIFEILEWIEHPEIDGAILYNWRDDPLYRPWMLWGYKEI